MGAEFPLPTIDEVAEELSDLQLLEKSTKQLQAGFWRPVSDGLTSKMHGILEGLRYSGHWGQIRPGKCLDYDPIRSNFSHIFMTVLVFKILM